MKSLILQEYDNIQRDSSGSLSKKDPFRGPQKGVYTFCPDYYDELRNELLRKDNEEWDSEELRGGIVSFVKLKNHGHQEIIQIQHYVGIILLADGFQIEVLPKIDVESNTEEEKKAKLERILLRMLGYLKDFPAIPADTADLDTKKTSLYEVFIQLYLFKVLSDSSRITLSLCFRGREPSFFQREAECDESDQIQFCPQRPLLCHTR